MKKEKENKPRLTKEEKKKELIRTIKFTLFSISAGLIEMGSFTIFTLLPGYNNEHFYWVAASASLILSVLWNFTLNRKFTFQSANNVPKAMFQVFLYYLVFGPLSIGLAQMYLIDTLGWNEYIVKGVVLFINFVTEFLYQRLYVFRATIDTKEFHFKKKKVEETPSEEIAIEDKEKEVQE